MAINYTGQNGYLLTIPVPYLFFEGLDSTDTFTAIIWCMVWPIQVKNERKKSSTIAAKDKNQINYKTYVFFLVPMKISFTFLSFYM